ncbi:mitochondrial fission process protein 1-like protein [Dinothrombium tinctorium]|uniref:Mitochondrial fission process protein 1 n=1 Tax=Dinothrombium tinctorium TaxID=1965070 RepID=A0A3S3PWI3_9ACAR|nr:mitochondrial fission process protein 1-like protein [Dinothrombium tinctorium]
MIAFGYCFADTAHKAMRASKAHETESKNKNVVYTAIDALIWQSLASVVIPGFTINRVCHASLFLMKKYSNMPSAARKWSTVFVGIGCIPFIVKPIDSFVDLMLDNSLRLLISNELRDVK